MDDHKIGHSISLESFAAEKSEISHRIDLFLHLSQDRGGGGSVADILSKSIFQREGQPNKI